MGRSDLIPDRIADKIDATGECWIWTGCIQKNGYGRCWDGSKVMYAHRFVYEASNGAIPKGLDLDHLCRNRSCVNPDHLEPVTRQENILRGDISKLNAIRSKNQTHCKYGHRFTDENTRLYRGRRHCRSCARNRYHMKKEKP